MDRRIAMLGLNVRAMNTLARKGISEYLDLLQMVKTNSLPKQLGKELSNVVRLVRLYEAETEDQRANRVTSNLTVKQFHIDRVR